MTQNIEKAIELINTLFQIEDSAGYAHLVFGDFNIDDDSILFCIEAAQENELNEYSEETKIASLNALKHFFTLTEKERETALNQSIDQKTKQ
jgi:hypothetical protein